MCEQTAALQAIGAIVIDELKAVAKLGRKNYQMGDECLLESVSTTHYKKPQ
jgi:uncharacterized protein (DUF934 family)